MKILIVGAGAAGTTCAIHLASVGFEVTLTEIPGYESRIETLRAFSKLQAFGLLKNDAQVKFVPVLSQARKADVVLVTTVADAHLIVAHCLEGSAIRPKAVIFFPGNAGTLFLKKWIRSLEHPPVLIEANTIPYGCRVRSTEPNVVDVNVLTPCVLYTGDKPEDSMLVRVMETLTPKPVFQGTLASVFLSNPNPLFHTLPCLLNVGWIEKPDSDFRMYEHGVTPSIFRALRAKDKERAHLLSVIPGTSMEWDALTGDVLGADGNMTTHHFLKCGRLAGFQGPHSLEYRYVTEDTATGLVCWERLGQIYHVPTPIITSEIDLISVLLQKDFRKIGSARASLLAA